jgi:hypothetical protein
MSETPERHWTADDHILLAEFNDFMRTTPLAPECLAAEKELRNLERQLKELKCITPEMLPFREGSIAEQIQEFRWAFREAGKIKRELARNCTRFAKLYCELSEALQQLLNQK